jgi:hypothetical protein
MDVEEVDWAAVVESELEVVRVEVSPESLRTPVACGAFGRRYDEQRQP